MITHNLDDEILETVMGRIDRDRTLTHVMDS